MEQSAELGTWSETLKRTGLRGLGVPQGESLSSSVLCPRLGGHLSPPPLAPAR